MLPLPNLFHKGCYVQAYTHCICDFIAQNATKNGINFTKSQILMIHTFALHSSLNSKFSSNATYYKFFYWVHFGGLELMVVADVIKKTSNKMIFLILTYRCLCVVKLNRIKRWMVSELRFFLSPQTLYTIWIFINKRNCHKPRTVIFIHFKFIQLLQWCKSFNWI